jgi:hypothetical protein
MSETLANELSLPLTEKKVGNDALSNGDKIVAANFVRFLPIWTLSEIEKSLNLAAYDPVLDDR